MIELKGERGGETYLVARDLWPSLATEPTFKPKLLALAVNRQNTLFLWEVNLPRPGDRTNEWTRTGLEALSLATVGWLRVTPNLDAGFYIVQKAAGPDPDWPTIPMCNLLRVAFRDQYIDSPDHPIPRSLRGEA
jgi:hypothetical protein